MVEYLLMLYSRSYGWRGTGEFCMRVWQEPSWVWKRMYFKLLDSFVWLLSFFKYCNSYQWERSFIIFIGERRDWLFSGLLWCIFSLIIKRFLTCKSMTRGERFTLLIVLFSLHSFNRRLINLYTNLTAPSWRIHLQLFNFECLVLITK